MTYKEEYWEHIEYMFHAFCKVIICNAMFKTLKLKDTKQEGRELSKVEREMEIIAYGEYPGHSIR